jgi:mono/diheme cytochrome c family protein
VAKIRSNIWENPLKLILSLLGTMALATACLADESPGKAIFDQTCKSCHGVDGKGDTAADKFYQVRIPRLTSSYVQQKSDEELTEIITKGVRKMKPVRTGRPVAEHSLKSEWTKDVISYVRTLKQQQN